MTRLLKNAALALAMAGAAMAQNSTTPPAGNRPARAGRGGLEQRLIRNLNLTDAQKAQAKQIFADAKTAAAPVRTELQTDRKTLAAAVKANDTVQIQQSASAAGAAQGQLIAIRSGAMAKFYAILTPDQQAQAEKMQKRLKQLMGRRARRQTNG